MKWTCKKIELFIDDYLEEKLSVRDKFTYEAHLDTCPGCREYFDRTSSLIKDAHRIGEALTTQDPAKPCQIPQRVWDQVAQLPTEEQLLLDRIMIRDMAEKHERLAGMDQARKKSKPTKPN
jgi:predicted anti-sigma-YlaC factor YlaD